MDESEKLQRNKFYPVMERVPFEDRERLNLPAKSEDGVQRIYAPIAGMGVNGVHAVWDGNPPRCPKKGEWYLSGAVIEAYRAPNDLSTPYYIANLVRTKTERKTVIKAV